jgi:hypothetical protein
MKCIDCEEIFTEPEKATAKVCVLCQGKMHAECAMEDPFLEGEFCEACFEDPAYGARLGDAGGVSC